MKAKFVLRKSTLFEQYERMSAYCDNISYSLKTNPIVGKVLEEEKDCMFSVHSLESAEFIQDRSRVILFLQACDAEILDKAFSLGIRTYVIDNVKDLEVLETYINRKKENITLFLRMRLKERTVHTGKHFVFGLYAKEVNTLLPTLKDNEYIKKLGVHFHRKTQNIQEWSMQYELKDSLSEESLSIISYLNIGGGMPVKYRNSRDRMSHVFSEITKLRDWLKNYNIKLIAEPGRYLAAPCITLHSRIISIDKKNIVVSCSVWNAAMDTFVANVRLDVKGELEKGEAYTIKGCTPDSVDIFRYRVFLDNPQVGDELVFLNAGAYNFHSDFCFLPKVETEIIA